MNVISIDPSKVCTGIYIKEDNKEHSLQITNKATASQEDSLINIVNGFNHILNDYKIDFGLVEGYAFNPVNRRSMIILSEIGGCIKYIFALNKIPLIQIPVMTWKSITIGNKINKSKDTELYLNTIQFKYGKLFKSTDEADAYLIYQAAKEIAKMTKRLLPSQKKIKEQLEKIIGG